MPSMDQRQANEIENKMEADMSSLYHREENRES